MSGVNGDKSRFHRQRKQKLARRIKTVEILRKAAENQKVTAPVSSLKPKVVLA